MTDVKLMQIAKRKKEARELAKQILDFGISEDQKIEIMFNIALTLENNIAMKEITSTLKKFIEKINKEDSEDNNKERGKLII